MDLIDLEQAVQELAGKIIVKRRDNEAQQRAQQAAIDKNEGKKIYSHFWIRELHFQKLFHAYAKKSKSDDVIWRKC